MPNELLDMVASEQAPGTDNVEAALVTVLKQKSFIGKFRVISLILFPPSLNSSLFYSYIICCFICA